MSEIRIKLIAALGVLLALWLAEALGLWRWFGAHPFWSLRGALVGGGIGVAMAVIIPRRLAFWSGALALCGGVAAAWFGKHAFVASYAADALAGRFWFIGYHLAMAGLAGLACVIAVRVAKTN